MPDQQEPDVPTPADYSPTSGAAAFAALLPQLAAEKPVRWRAIALAQAAERGSVLAKMLADPSVAANITAIEAAQLDATAGVKPGLAQRLRDLSHAVYYRASRQKATSAQTVSEARVPVSLWEEVLGLRRDLLETLTFVFRGHTAVETVLAVVRPGSGYRDHAQDLLILADLAEQHRATLQAKVPGFFDAEASTRATYLTAAMLDAVGEKTEAEHDDTDQRLWALFARTFREGQACLSFIWRENAEKVAQVPGLGSNRRGATRATPTATEPAAPPEEA